MSLTLIFVIATNLASLHGWKNDDFQRKWIFNPYSVNKYNQYYRFLTSGFIHADYIHLFFNMFVLYMFGEGVERTFVTLFGFKGYLFFGGLYLLGIIVSSIPTYLKFRHAAYYNSLGASGGTSSVLFSYVMFYPVAELCPYGITFLCLPGFIWMLLYLIYSYFMSKKGADNINHDAHITGGVFGIIFTFAVLPKVGSTFLEQIINYQMF